MIKSIFITLLLVILVRNIAAGDFDGWDGYFRV